MRLRGSETVLAVDDDPALIDLVEEILTPLGYKVIVAASGEEALEMMSDQQEKIDLLLIDVVLPGIKGQELAKRLLIAYPELRVLFMSGYLCPSMAHNGSEHGFESFIQKPFAPNSLLRKMRKLLDEN
ncbi:response regulator [Thermodesulfobacteriota bacterium]